MANQYSPDQQLVTPPPANRLKAGIIAVDPGPSCGFAVYHPYPAIPGKNFSTFTLTLGTEGHTYLERALLEEYWALRGWIGEPVEGVHQDISKFVWVVEKFEFRHDDQRRSKIDYTAGEYVGVCRFLAQKQIEAGHDLTLVMQGSAEGKGFWTNDRLEELNLLRFPISSKRHELDALRHLLRYMAFKRDQKWLLSRLRPAGRPPTSQAGEPIR